MKKIMDKRGVTLVELMIVVALLGVVAGMAGYTWLAGLNHSSLRGDAKDISANLRKAKQLAVGTNTPNQVYFDFVNMSYQLESCPSGGCYNGAANSHGTVISGPVYINTASGGFGHKPNVFVVNNITSAWAQYQTDGTVKFYDGTTGGDITLAVTTPNACKCANLTLASVGNPGDQKVVNIYPSGRITVP